VARASSASANANRRSSRAALRDLLLALSGECYSRAGNYVGSFEACKGARQF
jgi:hypothetical protein